MGFKTPEADSSAQKLRHRQNQGIFPKAPYGSLVEGRVGHFPAGPVFKDDASGSSGVRVP